MNELRCRVRNYVASATYNRLARFLKTSYYWIPEVSKKTVNCQIITLMTPMDMKTTNSFTQLNQLKTELTKFLNNVIRGLIKIDVV